MNSPSDQKYVFDRVFSADVGPHGDELDDEFFNAIGDYIQFALDGTHTCVLTYGQLVSFV